MIGDAKQVDTEGILDIFNGKQSGIFYPLRRHLSNDMLDQIAMRIKDDHCEPLTDILIDDILQQAALAHALNAENIHAGLPLLILDLDVLAGWRLFLTKNRVAGKNRRLSFCYRARWCFSCRLRFARS